MFVNPVHQGFLFVLLRLDFFFKVASPLVLCETAEWGCPRSVKMCGSGFLMSSVSMGYKYLWVCFKPILPANVCNTNFVVTSLFSLWMFRRSWATCNIHSYKIFLLNLLTSEFVSQILYRREYTPGFINQVWTRKQEWSTQWRDMKH